MGKQEQIYDDEFTLISTKRLGNFNEEFIRHTKSKFEEFKKIFGVDELHKLSFVLFDDLEEYRQYRREKDKTEPPSYSRGCYYNDTSVLVIDKLPEAGTKEFYSKRAYGAHEGFHVYYRDLVYKNPDDRVVWFDEGLAQYFSGEKDYLSKKQFKDYYSKFRKSYKPIENLNDRRQGNFSVPDDEIFQRKGVIEGYAISYLAIRYLAETKGIDFIKSIMNNKSKILELGNTIPKEMIKYYNEKILETEFEER